LLLAAMDNDAPAARQLRDKALELVQSAKGGKDDPRLLILRVDTLLTLGRNAEAQPIIQQLLNGGCRDPALVALLQRERVDTPVDPETKAKLQAVSNKGNGR